MKRLLFALFVIHCSLFALSGCGSNVSLGGRITFSDNGEPLTEGTIVFTNGTQQARSGIDTNGKYTLGFQSETDGLPKGEYKIAIHAIHSESKFGKTPEGEDMLLERKETPLIVKKYADANASGLVFTVDGKAKTFDIQVERAEKKK